MYLEPKIRTEFAKSISSASRVDNPDKQKIFIAKFSSLPDLKRSIYSKTWMDKVIKWVEYDESSKVADLINKNYNNPQAVLDYIIQHKKPI